MKRVLFFLVFSVFLWIVAADVEWIPWVWRLPCHHLKWVFSCEHRRTPAKACLHLPPCSGGLLLPLGFPKQRSLFSICTKSEVQIPPIPHPNTTTSRKDALPGMGSETNDTNVKRKWGHGHPLTSLPHRLPRSLSHSGRLLVNLGSNWHKHADGGARFMSEHEHHSDSMQDH